MTQIKKLKNSQRVQVYPQTHTKAVIDDNGYTAESRLQAMHDEINQAQLEVGAVPSDLTPTEGSANWVTSGGIHAALQNDEARVDNMFRDIIPNTEEKGFFVADADNNIGLQYNIDGLDTAKLSNHFKELLPKNGLGEVAEEGFHITDQSGNIGLRYDNDGLDAVKLSNHFRSLINDGFNKTRLIFNSKIPTYYVSPSGSDSNSGTKALPFKTLFQAITTCTEESNIILMTGIHEMNYDIEIDKDFPLHIFGQPNTILDGGEKVNYTSLSQGIYTFNVNRTDLLNHIIVNGNVRYPASTPKPEPQEISQMLSGQNVSSQSTDTGWYLNSCQMNVGTTLASYIADHIGECYITMFKNWFSPKSKILTANGSTGIITFNYCSANFVGNGVKYTIYNVDTNDTFKAGTFVFKKNSNQLLYKPLQDESVDNVYIPNFYKFDIKSQCDFSGIIFRNFGGSDFTDADLQCSADYQSAVYHTGMFEIVGQLNMNNCEFYANDPICLKYLRNAVGGTIENCLFHENGCEVLHVGDRPSGTDRPTRTAITDEEIPKNIVFRDNRVVNNGVSFHQSCALCILIARDSTFENNEVGYCPYSGISSGWQWDYLYTGFRNCIIKSNHIHHCGDTLLGDFGGIYTVGNGYHSVVENNYIHDVVTGTNNTEADGIFTDEQSHLYTFKNNIIVNPKIYRSNKAVNVDFIGNKLIGNSVAGQFSLGNRKFIGNVVYSNTSFNVINLGTMYADNLYYGGNAMSGDESYYAFNPNFDEKYGLDDTIVQQIGCAKNNIDEIGNVPYLTKTKAVDIEWYY